MRFAGTVRRYARELNLTFPPCARSDWQNYCAVRGRGNVRREEPAAKDEIPTRIPVAQVDAVDESAWVRRWLYLHPASTCSTRRLAGPVRYGSAPDLRRVRHVRWAGRSGRPAGRRARGYEEIGPGLRWRAFANSPQPETDVLRRPVEYRCSLRIVCDPLRRCGLAPRQ